MRGAGMKRFCKGSPLRDFQTQHLELLFRVQNVLLLQHICMVVCTAIALLISRCYTTVSQNVDLDKLGLIFHIMEDTAKHF
jgi:hypothetical protein